MKYKISEKYSVIEPLKQYIEKYSTSSEEPKWEYINPNEIENYRTGQNKPILEEIFIKQIIKLNPFLTQEDAKQILKQLQPRIPNIEGNKTVLEFLKGEKNYYIASQKREKNIKLIDTENIKNNLFHYTEEFIFKNEKYTIRQDKTFFINGIPLIFIEAKAPHEDIKNKGLQQVKRYHEEVPELLAIQQIFILTNTLKFLYGATWNISSKTLYDYKQDNIADLEETIKNFFKPQNIIKLITDYTFFVRKNDTLQKIVLRPHQFMAIEKIIDRAIEGKKKRALIWHTQGSGKTFTMITLAKKLIQNPIFKNPTVIMLVDRNELESQLFQNISSADLDVKVIKSKKDLEDTLKHNYRGIIITTIQKFEGAKKNLNTAENIFVLVDEAHRTTNGKLGNYMMGALPNAMFIGFTGTPIDKTNHGKSTFLIFGKEDQPHGYLHKYSISQSIKDGTTLKIHYTLAPNDLKIDKELLEKEFLSIKETEGISDIDELNKILDKAVKLKTAIKSPDRIQKTAKFIAQHYRDYVEPLGYKAFVVAVDREACTYYKEELDKYLPPNYTKTVFSPNHNDPQSLKRYHLSEEEEKSIRKSFIDPEKEPKILIVTNKLLTGFDAPVLYCLYLDKPMRDHILLQTIARVNRPFEDSTGRIKPSGLVVDFIGIFDNLQKALTFDSADIEGVVDDIEKLKERFKILMQKVRSNYINKLGDTTRDKLIELIIDYFRDEETRKKFYEDYKEINDIYNILSPDSFLRPYLEDISLITKIYKAVKMEYEPYQNPDTEITKKLENLLKRYTYQSDIQFLPEIYEINENLIEKIQLDNTQTDTEKIFNLSNSIKHMIAQERSIYLKSIKDKLENIMQQYRNKQKTTKQALQHLKEIIEEINLMEKEKSEKGLSAESFAVYWLLKQKGIKEPEKITQNFIELTLKYPHWKTSEHQKKKLKESLLLDYGLEIDIIKEIIQTLENS